MRRSLLIAVVVLLAFPAAARTEEKSLFRIYLDDRTPENFMNAYRYYQDQLRDTLDFSAVVVLAYLNNFELEKNLGILEENTASLKNMNMFQYANILLALGRYDEAIVLYVQLNEKSPKWSCPWRHKGEAYWKKKEYGEAVKALEKAIETRETHYDAYVMLAGVLKDMGEYAGALQTLEKGLTYFGKDTENPKEETADLDVSFLHLELLGRNNMTDEYNELYEKLKKAAPDDERLK